MLSKRTVCVTSMYNVGCTFLDWSILFLSGQNHYYQASESTALALPSDPLTAQNAHNYHKNHPHGIEQSTKVMDALAQQNDCNLTSFYPGPPHINPICQQLNIGLDQLHRPGTMFSILHHQRKEYNSIIQQCFDRDIPVVYVAVDPSFTTFMTVPRGDYRLAWSGEESNSPKDLQYETYNILYSQNDEYWEAHGLTNIWDRRERLALDIRPLEISHPNNTDGFEHPHYWIDSRDLWYRGEVIVKQVLDFLNLPLVDSRYQDWQAIYHKWRIVANRNIDFMVNLDHMVKSIVMGWYYELGDLDLYQEAVIQHCLIYQYNLNLKTWEISKFPNNTQQLHCLLETNIHSIS